MRYAIHTINEFKYLWNTIQNFPKNIEISHLTSKLTGIDALESKHVFKNMKGSIWNLSNIYFFDSEIINVSRIPTLTFLKHYLYSLVYYYKILDYFKKGLISSTSDPRLIKDNSHIRASINNDDFNLACKNLFTFSPTITTNLLYGFDTSVNRWVLIYNSNDNIFTITIKPYKYSAHITQVSNHLHNITNIKSITGFHLNQFLNQLCHTFSSVENFDQLIKEMRFFLY